MKSEILNPKFILRSSTATENGSETISENPKRIINEALREDLGSGDITTNVIVPENKTVKAILLAKEDGIICGLEIAKTVFYELDKSISFIPTIKDGDQVKKGKVVAEIEGKARGILTGERTALNFLQHLSGIATLTSEFVKKSGKAKVLDTRKTTPGLRAIEKFAVKMGGGTNHRMGLYDAILIKDNHIAIAGGIDKAIWLVRKDNPKIMIEIETKTLDEVKKAIELKVQRILLDNMNIKMLKEAVKLCKKAKIATEASGGVNLSTISAIAKTGVDFISIGALTHSAKALDISLDIV